MAKTNGSTKPGRGRPTVMTDETRRRVIQTLQLGLDLKTAAAFAGITYRTVANFRASDEQFFQATEEARAQAVVAPCMVVLEVMRNVPVDKMRNGVKVKVKPYTEAEQMKMIRWFMEHRSPEFGPKIDSSAEDAAKVREEQASTLASIIRGMDENVLRRDDPVETNGSHRRN